MGRGEPVGGRKNNNLRDADDTISIVTSEQETVEIINTVTLRAGMKGYSAQSYQNRKVMIIVCPSCTIVEM